MALEDLTGSKTINNLNPAWPLGTDLPDAGDDHLRGIKNTIKNTFPNIVGPVTLTDVQLNRGAIPIGSVLPFYQATAPAGWERVAGITQTFGLRIVASATAGGVGGGTDDPILNNRVPSHIHDYSATTLDENANHSHDYHAVSSYVSANGSHNHGVVDPGHLHTLGNQVGSPGSGIEGGNSYQIVNATTGSTGTGIYLDATDTNHTHNVDGVTTGVSTTHKHPFSGTTAANASAASWTPRYLDMILCRRIS